MLYCPVTSKVYMLASNRLDENHNRLCSAATADCTCSLGPPPLLNLWNLLLGYLQRCRSIYKVNATDLMRHWTSLNAFADETGVEAVWLSLVLQIICAYWRCHSNQTETGVCACACASSFGVIFHDGFGNRHFGLLVQKSRVVTVATLEGMHAFLQ